MPRFLVLTILFLGCALPDLVPGAIQCGPVAAGPERCPPTWTCIVDRCWPEGWDAGTDRDASVQDARRDASSDARTDAASDAPDASDAPVELDSEADASATEDTPRDAPAPTRPSCPDPGERGCGSMTLPGGTYTMGSDTINESPRHLATVSPFELDAFEVTVARFRRYWYAGHPGPGPSVRYPSGALAWTGSSVMEPVAGDALDSSNACNWNTADRDLHPINCIDWWTAQAFCVWDGGRLPTEAEWEYAARGYAEDSLATGRTYPWGEEAPSCARAAWNYPSCRGEDGTQTRRVGSFTSSAGFYDLAGNVWEWTADNWATYDTLCWAQRTNPLCNLDATGERTVRGGSAAQTTPALLHGAARMQWPPIDRTRAGAVGFRCARSL
jgi:formylglycine-generating enzyme required for sulfatase activity